MRTSHSAALKFNMLKQAQSDPVFELCRENGISELTYHDSESLTSSASTSTRLPLKSSAGEGKPQGTRHGKDWRGRLLEDSCFILCIYTV